MATTASTKPLNAKLGIKPGDRVLVLNPQPDSLAALEPLPEGVTVRTAGNGPFDCVVVFANTRSYVELLAPLALRAVKPGGLLWMAYPKGGSTDIHRDKGWDALVAAGWDTVSLVAVDDVWSALRFRPRDAIGAKKKRATAAG